MVEFYHGSTRNPKTFLPHAKRDTFPIDAKTLSRLKRRLSLAKVCKKGRGENLVLLLLSVKNFKT